MPTDRWIDKNVVHIYNGKLLSHKNEIMPFAVTWMNLEIIILSEVSQTEERQICGVTYMCHLKKNDTNELIHKSRLTDLENKLMVTRGRDRLGVWDWHVHTSVFKIR